MAQRVDALRYRPSNLKEGQCVLKALGYAHILEQIERHQPSRVLEVGHGPASLLFETLKDSPVELWGLDDYTGTYGTLSEQYTEFRNRHQHRRFVKGLLGGGASGLPLNYFDMVCSVSVLEHVPEKNLNNLFGEIHDVLRVCGRSVHSVDMFRNRNPRSFYDAHLKSGLRWDKPSRPLPICDSSIVMMEDPRAVMEYYMGAIPVEKRPWPGNFVTILMGGVRDDAPEEPRDIAPAQLMMGSGI